MGGEVSFEEILDYLHYIGLFEEMLRERMEFVTEFWKITLMGN